MPEESLKHKTKTGMYWTFLNQFANNGLQFVVGVIMARILSPSDYGITALPAIFITIAGVFMYSGFSTALIRKPDISEKDISTAFYYSLLVGVLCYIMLFIAAPYISSFYNIQVLTPLIRVATLTFLWSPLSTPQTVILTRKLDFKTTAKVAIFTKTIGAIVGITAAYLGFGVWALVVMSVVSNLTSTILLWITVKWTPTEKWSRDSFKYLWGFGNKILASGILDALYGNLTPILIGKFYSTNQLGLYNRAYGYASLPSQQGTSVIQSVTFPVLSKLQDDENSLINSYRKILKVSAFVIFPIMTLLSALAKPVIIILITEKWVDAILLLQLLCFAMMWYPIHSINLNLLQVKGRSDLFLRLEIWKKCLGLAVTVCSLPFGLTYFVSAQIASSFISLFINTHYTGKLFNVGFMKQMHDLLPTYSLSILIFIVVSGMNHFIDNLWAQLVLGGSVGLGLYLGLAYLFRFKELEDVQYMLNRKK